MTGPSWLIDSKRIASKIKNASAQGDPSRVKWISNPTKACPRCGHIIDNSDVVQEWPGLPRGVKFDPSDQELLYHLRAKVGHDGAKFHPFINEFIPTLEEGDGICYTHPQKLPGVKQDGSVSHFFHRTFRAYNTGTRKRRKINSSDLIDVRWHKTGKTKPVTVDGKHLGCKKILVLYMVAAKGGKPEKTNWVIHQYHIGTGEDEKDGEYVVSKIFYQKQPKPGDKVGLGQIMEAEVIVEEIDPVPEVRAVYLENHADRAPECHADQVREHHANLLDDVHISENIFQADANKGTKKEEIKEDDGQLASEDIDDHDNNTAEDLKWWEGESQYLLDSQQLAEGIAICEEFLLSQSSCNGDETKKNIPRLSDYAGMGVEHLKRDLEECQKLDTTDHANNVLDMPPDRLSQLEFGSQDSFSALDMVRFAD